MKEEKGIARAEIIRKEDTRNANTINRLIKNNIQRYMFFCGKNLDV